MDLGQAFSDALARGGSLIMENDRLQAENARLQSTNAQLAAALKWAATYTLNTCPGSPLDEEIKAALAAHEATQRKENP